MKKTLPCSLLAGNQHANPIHGIIKHLAPGQEAGRGYIGLIDSASPGHEPALYASTLHRSAVLCKTGSRTCHLAIVGRETGALLARPESTEFLREGMRVCIDPGKREIIIENP